MFMSLLILQPAIIKLCKQGRGQLIVTKRKPINGLSCIVLHTLKAE